MPRYIAEVIGLLAADEFLDPNATPTPCPSTPILTMELPIEMDEGQVTDVILRVRIRSSLPG